MDRRILQLGSAQFGMVNVPTALYKFFDNETFAHEFLSCATLRIGTLFDYRRVEAHGTARGDDGEGKFDYVHESSSPELITLENAPPHLRYFIEQTGIPLASNGGMITAKGSHPDCYVYCVSSSARPGSGDYGSYGIRIDDAHGFFGELTRHLYDVRSLLKEPHGFAAPCIYRERTGVSHSLGEFQAVPMAFIKPLQRAVDQEVRGVWYPTEHPVEPFVTTCDRLRAFQTEVASLRAQSTATVPGAPGTDIASAQGALRAVVEQYPELKTNESFLRLQRELADTETRIALARDYFNEIATYLNTRLETVPDRWIVPVAGLQARALIAAESFERAVVAVNLG